MNTEDNGTLRLSAVHQVLSDWTGVSVKHLRAGDDMKAALEKLPRQLRERIIGQDEAIDAAVDALRRQLQLKPALRDEGPVAVLLFAGPSGVGKTETARQIARLFYESEERFLKRIDLSEFTSEHTAARLVGAPPGYVGYGRGGELVNALKDERHGVLLLDEVEKAHPKVLTDVLLPLLGDGIVHDMNTGQTVDASNYLIIMTSNLGTNRHLEGESRSLEASEELETRIMKAVRSTLPNEFLGRVDDITVFHPLSRDDIREIWQIRLKEFKQKLDQQHGGFSSLDVSSSAEDFLIRRAQQNAPTEGARAIKKVLDQIVVARSLDLLAGSVHGDAAWSLRIEQTDEGNLRFALQSQTTGEAG